MIKTILDRWEQELEYISNEFEPYMSQDKAEEINEKIGHLIQQLIDIMTPVDTDITIFVEGGCVTDVVNNRKGHRLSYDIVDSDIPLHEQIRDIYVTKNSI